MLKGNKVWTPNGYQAGPVNSLVGKGESIIDYENGTGTLVTKGKVGVDNQPSSVRRDDNNVIAGNDVDWSNGMKFSDQIAPLTAKLEMYNDIEKRVNKKPELSSLSKQTMELQKGQLERAKAPILQAMKNITDRQEKQHQIEDYTAQIKANRGMDRFDDGKGFWSKLKTSLKSYGKAGKGKVSGAVIDAGYLAPSMLELSMLNHWRNENPVMPNIYAENKYAPIALQTMAGNRISANPVLEKLYAQDRQAAYQLANSGGYTGGQRQANRTALALGNQRNVADALMNVQEKNIGYRSDYAKMAASLGDSDAQRQQQANQYGWEAYNKAHGQKTKGIETHLANLGLIGQKWLGQRIKNKQYGDVLDMYQQDLDMKKKAMLAQFGGQGGSTGANTTGASGSGSTGRAGASGGSTIGGVGASAYTNTEPPASWHKEALKQIDQFPLPDIHFTWSNPLDNYDWDKYFSAVKKDNGIVMGKNGNPRSETYYAYNPDPKGINTVFKQMIAEELGKQPVNSAYMTSLAKATGKSPEYMKENYYKYLGGPLTVRGTEPLGYVRTSMRSEGSNNFKKFNYPFGANQIYRDLMVYNSNKNLSIPLLPSYQVGSYDRITGTDSQEMSGMRFNKGKNRRRR